MRIEDMLHEALLREARCDRCPAPGVAVHVELVTPNSESLASYRLCRACFADFNWFIVTPPPVPVPDTSSADTLGMTEGGS